MSVSALDATNIEIYGGDDDAVMVAPLGTTAPVGIAAPTAPFKNVGWLSDDGISWDDATDKVTITAHQGGVEVIEVTTKVTRTFKFQCLEETALVLGLRYPGFTPVQVGTEQVYGGEVPTPVTDRRVWIIDTYSISNPGHRVRKVVPIGQVSTVGTMVMKRGEVTVYEFEVKVMEGKFFIYGTNLNPAG